MKTRKAWPYLGFLVAVAMVWGASVVVLRSMGSPTARREAKYQAAERAVFYRLDPGDSLRFDVAAQAKELRLVTHLVLPPGATYAPESQYVYGFELAFEHAEGPAPTALFTRTRQSKDEQKDGMWARENAFAIDTDTQLTDGREFLVQVPETARAKAGTVLVKYAGTRGSLLVRVYGHYERLQSLFVKSEQVRRAESRVERATALPWEKLPLARQRELARIEWEALNAQGEVGRDYDTFTLYRTDFRLPLVEVAEAAQTYLAPGSGVAVNVLGPATPTLRLWRDGSFGVDSQQDVEVRAVSTDGARQTWTLPRPVPGEVTAHPLELPPGVHSLEVMNSGDSELRYSLEGAAASWFAPPELKGTTDGTVALLPDLQRSEAFVVGPACTPALVELMPGSNTWGRLLRVDARAMEADDDAPPQVTLSLFDAGGKHLGDTELMAGVEPSPFEAAELPLDLEKNLPCAESNSEAPRTIDVDATRRPGRTFVAATGKLFLPATARRVEVRANRPVAVNLSTYLPSEGEPFLGAPYGGVTSTSTRWAHAPVDRRGWHPLRPMNHGELARQGAQVTLVRQVRLEPLGPELHASGTGDPLTLHPHGTPASLELFEPDREARDPESARSLFSLLTPGRPVRARFDARSPTRPELRLHLDGTGGLGHEVEIVIDGKVVRRQRLSSTRARALLPPIPSGTREVMVRSHAPGLSVALNRAPAAGEEDLAHRSRTVYRLGGGGLRIPVVKKGTGAETLNIVVYTSRAELTEKTDLKVTIDRGHPARRTGVLVPRITRAERRVELLPTARPAGSVAGRPNTRWYPRTIPVVLAEDLAPGTHWVEVKPDRDAQMWARFFVYGDADPATDFRQWNRPGWDLEDSP